MSATASALPHSAPPALTAVQEKVIAHLAAGQSIRDLTEECQIHRNTIGNWRRTNPAFAQALAQAQYDRVLVWRDFAEEHAALAIQTIAHILLDEKAPASVRLRAALAMLKHATTPPPAPPIVVDSPSEEDSPESAAPSPVQPSPKSRKMHKVAQMPHPPAPLPEDRNDSTSTGTADPRSPLPAN